MLHFILFFFCCCKFDTSNWWQSWTIEPAKTKFKHFIFQTVSARISWLLQRCRLTLAFLLSEFCNFGLMYLSLVLSVCYTRVCSTSKLFFEYTEGNFTEQYDTPFSIEQHHTQSSFSIYWTSIVESISNIEIGNLA